MKPGNPQTGSVTSHFKCLAFLPEWWKDEYLKALIWHKTKTQTEKYSCSWKTKFKLETFITPSEIKNIDYLSLFFLLPHLINIGLTALCAAVKNNIQIQTVDYRSIQFVLLMQWQTRNRLLNMVFLKLWYPKIIWQWEEEMPQWAEIGLYIINIHRKCSGINIQ